MSGKFNPFSSQGRADEIIFGMKTQRGFRTRRYPLYLNQIGCQKFLNLFRSGVISMSL